MAEAGELTGETRSGRVAGTDRTIATAIRRLRTVAAVIAGTQLILVPSDAEGWRLPIPPALTMVALACAVGSINLLSAMTADRTSRIRRLTNVCELIVDATLALLVAAGLPGLDESMSWAILAVPVLEAALRFRPHWATLTWLGVSVSYAALLLRPGSGTTAGFTVALFDRLELVTHRAGVILLVTVPAGYLATHLVEVIAEHQAARAAAHDRANSLRAVARASEKVSQLDVDLFDTIAACALELGFDDMDLCRAEPESGQWRVIRRANTGQSLLTPPDTEIVNDEIHIVTAVQRSRRLGRHTPIEVVTVPIGTTPHTLVLRAASLDPSDGHVERIESLELLAAQMTTALRNSDLVAELRAAKDELHYRAFHDGLTGLPNRSMFHAEVSRALSSASEEHAVAVLFLDLDRFKEINDTLGHDTGDELLAGVARRLGELVSHRGLTARLGGDEFTILLRRVVEADDPDMLAADIVDAFRRPFYIRGRAVTTSVSIGIATASDADADVNDLMRRSDAAMYAAKLARPRERELTSLEPMQPIEVEGMGSRRDRLTSDLPAALGDGEFRLEFHPVQSATSECIGVTAQARWDHPIEGPVVEPELSSIAHGCRLGEALQTFALESAVASIAAWNASGARDFFVATKVARLQIVGDDFLGFLSDLLATWNVDPQALMLEVVEPIGDQPEVRARLRLIRSLGVRLAFDGFDGWPSLKGVLNHVDFDLLKLPAPERSTVLASHHQIPPEEIVAIAHKLNIHVVATAVETHEQLEDAIRSGYDGAQGPLLGPAREPAEVAFGRLVLEPEPVEGSRGTRT